MPDIIFNLRYRYTQYTTRKLNEIEKKKQIDTKKANEYYDRDEACDKTISTDKAFNYYDYRIGSMGGFNAKGPVNAKITQAECDHYRPEIVYQGVFSFKKDFALKSGILEKKDMEKLIRKSMTNVIRQLNLDPDNVIWNAAYHTNTDNPHCHFMMYEKKVTRKKLLLSKTKMERVRSEVLSESGKGFAVVADQIGKLAGDSAQAAVNTRDLIEKSLQEIENGNQITEKTVAALNKILESMNDFANAAKGASESSTEQANMLKQIEQGIEQISSVVQSNSAAAEETSATSQELSAQSEGLKNLVGRFKLAE